ncbi:Outer membrane protein A [Paraburkholderia domus]|uniref:Outer membrane protein A n=1 Tax=Paraburkholderia domus TaxID=2793075 RepID=A0A9N8NBY4_9BURK|nr:OmpA family protein [Paraburkholderia domus]MBK5088556.1 OmpA family protein [Burkholderia sp. R-69927]MBK5123629.1 OmpA family protein [Burkholderia sp. R-69980]MBK5169180.1 OmpA family protein [Burkholderia sp. R-70211]CAE6832865.1 Outer membrane protein A [Paraburkholderia domus]CAE6880435.1 Outer membrane protein A [Paraburkholderia domus]
MSDLRLGYPFRAVIILAVVLALAVLFQVLPAGREVAWVVATGVVLVALAAVVLRTLQRNRAREQSAHVLAALGATTADLPVSLRTRMPLVLVTGDSLVQLFNRAGDEERLTHVGDGAIWLRVDNPRDLPRVAVAVKQWRDGRAPDGVVLSIAPALHAGEDVLTQALRLARQAVSDASRMLGTRLPGYIAIYQRLTATPAAAAAAAGLRWYGVSSTTRLADAHRFEAVMQAAEAQVHQTGGDPVSAARAAALASVIGWTQRVVIGPLTGRLQPATPWALFGMGWIDCGPASDPRSPWARDVRARSGIMPPPMAASPVPWPMPQPLIESMPRRLWVSPRLAALAHAIALLACAGALAIWGSAKNNQALLAHIGADLGRFSMIPAAHDTARRDALQALVADRDQIDHYARLGVPARLSFGMYRGAPLMPVLNDAIASYETPPPPPAVVTLDSMSLFDSGRAQLKPGSNRAVIGALEMIKAHPDKRILVAGYTDNVGNADGNLRLSMARAGAVRDWLVEASGIPVTQFAIQGYGDTRPIAGNDTDAGRAKNRRVEITLVPDAPKEVPLGGAQKEAPKGGATGA